jgi:hypothetical protein
MATLLRRNDTRLPKFATGVLAGVLWLAGCAGFVPPSGPGGTSASSAVSTVTVSPGSALVSANGTVQFAVAIQGSTPNKTVTWKASGGTITPAGLFTAPSAPGTVSITAISAVDPTKSGSVAVTVTQAKSSQPVTSVTITPATASSITRGTLPFAATVQGTTSNQTVTWKASMGTISSSGLYTAPATTGIATVTATSNADPTKSASATIGVTAAGAAAKAPIITEFSASPTTIQAGQSSSLQWGVSGANSVEISGIGVVTGTTGKVTPAQTTTYTLMASNASGTASQNVTVAVAGHTSSQLQPFELGVVTHFGQDHGNVQANVALIQQMGGTTIRDEVYWKEVEHIKGQYALPSITEPFVNAALARGLKPLLTLDYGNPLYDGGGKPLSDDAIQAYANYAAFVATQLKGRVFLYEIWNEWDMSAGQTTPGTPQAYVKLLKAVYPKLKAVDPNIVVVGGGVSAGAILSPWFGQMLDAGALSSADAISIHEYIYTSTGSGRSPETLASKLLGVEQTLRSHNGSQDFPLYLTETGWPTNTGTSGTTLAEAGDFDAETMLLMPSMSFLKGIYWYDFQDDGSVATDPEDNFGLVHVNLSPKPGFYAISAARAWMAGTQFSSRIKTSDPSVDGIDFLLPNGQHAVAVWKQGTGTSSVQVRGASSVQTINASSANTTSASVPSSLAQNLSESPLWFVGDTLDLQ